MMPLTADKRPTVADLRGAKGKGRQTKLRFFTWDGAAVAAEAAGSSFAGRVLTMPEAERNTLMQGIGG